jgi:hypothetical protein
MDLQTIFTSSQSKKKKKVILIVVVHYCNPSTGEAETEGSPIQGQPGIHREPQKKILLHCESVYMYSMCTWTTQMTEIGWQFYATYLNRDIR